MKELLKKLNACDEAIEWAKDKSWKEIYNTCHRGDWLLWLYKRTNPDDLQRLTLAKGHCANTVRHLMNDERSIKAVDTAIAFGEGKAILEELSVTASAAYAAASAAYFGAYAAYFGAYAAYVAAYAAYAAAYDYAAAAYAAYDYGADAAAYAAYDYGADAADAKTENQKLTADICRKHLPIEIWNINL